MISECFTETLVKRDQEVRGLCPCGRAEKRPGQRNCRSCHALANTVYRARKRERDRRDHITGIAAIAEKLAKPEEEEREDLKPE